MTVRAELLGDYHVHSTFSDDAVSTIAENIAAASAAGLTVVRFIDHVRASTEWVPQFAAAVAAEPVPEGLTVLTGVETKLWNVAGDLDVPADLSSAQAIVIADHQFPGPDGPWTPAETMDHITNGMPRARLLDMFIDASVAAMVTFSHKYPNHEAQLAHWFSILPKVGLHEDDLSDQQLETWAAAAATTGTIIEVNEKWACPGPRALRAAFAAGARVVASTDSHVSSDVGRYDRVVGLLDEARS
jgi:putative hydrolase